MKLSRLRFILVFSLVILLGCAVNARRFVMKVPLSRPTINAYVRLLPMDMKKAQRLYVLSSGPGDIGKFNSEDAETFDLSLLDSAAAGRVFLGVSPQADSILRTDFSIQITVLNHMMADKRPGVYGAAEFAYRITNHRYPNHARGRFSAAATGEDATAVKTRINQAAVAGLLRLAAAHMRGEPAPVFKGESMEVETRIQGEKPGADKDDKIAWTRGGKFTLHATFAEARDGLPRVMWRQVCDRYELKTNPDGTTFNTCVAWKSVAYNPPWKGWTRNFKDDDELFIADAKLQAQVRDARVTKTKTKPGFGTITQPGDSPGGRSPGGDSTRVAGSRGFYDTWVRGFTIRPGISVDRPSLKVSASNGRGTILKELGSQVFYHLDLRTRDVPLTRRVGVAFSIQLANVRMDRQEFPEEDTDSVADGDDDSSGTSSEPVRDSGTRLSGSYYFWIPTIYYRFRYGHDSDYGRVGAGLGLGTYRMTGLIHLTGGYNPFALLALFNSNLNASELLQTYLLSRGPFDIRKVDPGTLALLGASQNDRNALFALLLLTPKEFINIREDNAPTVMLYYESPPLSNLGLRFRFSVAGSDFRQAGAHFRFRRIALSMYAPITL